MELKMPDGGKGKQRCKGGSSPSSESTISLPSNVQSSQPQKAGSQLSCNLQSPTCPSGVHTDCVESDHVVPKIKNLHRLYVESVRSPCRLCGVRPCSAQNGWWSGMACRV